MSEKTVILVRHARAGYGSRGGDIERPLTDDGQVQARVLGTAIASQLRGDVTVFVSPAKRAQETWAEMAAAAGLDAGQARTRDVIYGDGCGAWIDLIRNEGEGRAVVLVGHEPTVSETAEVLAEPDVPTHWSVPTGTAVVLTGPASFKDWGPGSAASADYITA